MFCRKNPEKIVAMASWLILGGVLPLSVALVAQFGFNLPPCHFCLLQRYPYLVVIAAGIGCLVFERMNLKWRLCVAFGIMALLATAILGLIHSGIESGYLHYTGGCVAQSGAGQSLDDLRAAINAAPLVACNNPLARIAGLTMAGWNVVWAVSVMFLVALQSRFERKRYANLYH